MGYKFFKRYIKNLYFVKVYLSCSRIIWGIFNFREMFVVVYDKLFRVRIFNF